MTNKPEHNPAVSSGITIVIPVRNREELVKETLASISAQTVLPEALILVDDGSTDGTRRALDEYADAETRFGVKVIGGTGRGSCAARNLGLEAVGTEWTMFFDSDDVMLPGHIERAIRTAHASPRADIIGWDVMRIDNKGERRLLPFEISDISWHNLMHGTMATQRYMARTSLFRRANGWNINAPIWNDIELGARLLALMPVVVKADGLPTVEVRAHDRSLTGASWSARADAYKVTLGLLRNPRLGMSSRWLDMKQAILAADIAREDSTLGAAFYRSIGRRNALTRMAYLWRRIGLRGTARLVRPFAGGHNHKEVLQ